MSRVETPNTPSLGELLADDQYVRQRLEPRRVDLDYLVLTDLRLVITRLAPQVRGRLFDYGSGAAPYRRFFKQCSEYIAADVTPGPTIDRLLAADGSTGEPSGAYDVILSTQVLEHVRDPDDYLDECYRILRPGGRLILSTHGMIEEHGCPYDFHRWTSRGLEELVIAHGFTVLESLKFTTELRAVAQLVHQFALHLRSRRGGWTRYPWAVIRRLYSKLCLPLLNWLADRVPDQSVLPSSDPASLYVGVCIVAAKA
jgi:SAM-dependent methyltransferase